jgi:hypothetical protein
MHRRWSRKVAWSLAGAVALLVLLACLALGAWPVPSICGNLQARIDLARGRPKLLEAGLPSMGRPRFNRLLRQRYGVEASVIGGCTVSNFILAYVDVYDEVIESSLRKRYGRDVLREAFEEVAAY